MVPPKLMTCRPGEGKGLGVALLGRVRAELPVVGKLSEREQVMTSACLTRLRSARTRRAYAGVRRAP
jgi:hypothetical protein